MTRSDDPNVNGERNMYKGLIITLSIALMGLATIEPLWAQVYKVVDENGNVTYTDEPPKDGTPEMVLPEISVIESDYEPEPSVADQAAADGTGEATGDEEEALSPRELRGMFKDFRILTPEPEETYWGTANTVVVSWGASTPYEKGMSVSVVLNGAAQEASPTGNVMATLDRGEHKVYAVLMDEGGTRIATSETVTFYVQQATIRTNRR